MIDETEAASHWRAYFAPLGPRLILFARQWLPDTADAEDAVQDAFIRFWRKHQNPDERHTGLLFAAVRHSALDILRSSTRRKHRELASAEHDMGGTVSMVEPNWFLSTDDDGRALEVALQQLGAEQRQVLVLKIWGELTFAQISEILAESPNTVASRYRYAINALRKILPPICHER